MKIHTRISGKSRTFDGEDLGLSQRSRDDEIRSVLSRVYEIPSRSLQNLVIDRNPDGVVVRPPAVFG